MLLLNFKPVALLAALALGAVSVPTRIECDLAVIATVALVDVTAEGRGAAVEDGPHYARLPTVETRHGIAALAADVGQLELRSISTAVLDRRAWHASAFRECDVAQVGQDVEWTGCVLEIVPSDVGIDLRGLQTTMAQK